MIRLLLCLAAALAVAVGLLLLRQQRLQVRHECNVLHARILDAQRELWRQQLRVAVETVPDALRRAAERQASAVPGDAEVAAPDDWAEFGTASAW